MKVGLVIDESEKYDGCNWHDVYAKEFEKLGDEIIFLDFKKMDWLKQIEIHKIMQRQRYKLLKGFLKFLSFQIGRCIIRMTIKSCKIS